MVRHWISDFSFRQPYIMASDFLFFFFSLSSIHIFFHFSRDGAMPLEVMACIHIPLHRHKRILWSSSFRLASAIRNRQYCSSIGICFDLPWAEVVHSLRPFLPPHFSSTLYFLPNHLHQYCGNAPLRQCNGSRDHSG